MKKEGYKVKKPWTKAEKKKFKKLKDTGYFVDKVINDLSVLISWWIDQELGRETLGPGVADAEADLRRSLLQLIRTRRKK